MHNIKKKIGTHSKQIVTLLFHALQPDWSKNSKGYFKFDWLTLYRALERHPEHSLILVLWLQGNVMKQQATILLFNCSEWKKSGGKMRVMKFWIIVSFEKVSPWCDWNMMWLVFYCRQKLLLSFWPCKLKMWIFLVSEWIVNEFFGSYISVLYIINQSRAGDD